MYKLIAKLQKTNMATLSNPTFQVDTLTGMPSDYRVWGTVTVGLTPFENSLIQMGYPLYLQSNIWADDTSSIALAEGPSPSDYRNNTDDLIFAYFANQPITGPGTYTVSAIIPRRVLDEDNYWSGERDEAYNTFYLESRSHPFPSDINYVWTHSPTVTGIAGT
jgi:hypothetical protein